MLSVHFYRSAFVTSIVVALFALFVFKNSEFRINSEYQLVPEGFVLPKGCDIKIDMQTGETWARISKGSNDNSLISIKEPEANKQAYPEYKNITKNRVQARLSLDVISSIESALNSLELDESWEYLEEEAPAMEFGLAIFESAGFEALRRKLAEADARALSLVAVCLQNNPLAIDKFIELKVHLNEINGILLLDQLDISVFKKIIRILESLNDTEFNEKCKENVRRHANQHQLKEERYTEFLSKL